MVPGWSQSSVVDGLGSVLSTKKVRIPPMDMPPEIQTPRGKDGAVPDLQSTSDIDQSRLRG